jgi:hypothetical protein
MGGIRKQNAKACFLKLGTDFGTNLRENKRLKRNTL